MTFSSHLNPTLYVHVFAITRVLNIRYITFILYTQVRLSVITATNAQILSSHIQNLLIIKQQKGSLENTGNSLVNLFIQ